MKTTLLAPPHTQKVFEPEALRKLLRDTVAIARVLKKEWLFNAIAVCGHSSLILGSLVAYRMKLPLLAVRKDRDDHCADSSRVNGAFPRNCRFLILDDLISSGDTVKGIAKAVYKVADEVGKRQKKVYEAECVGALLYHDINRTKYWLSDEQTIPVRCVYEKKE